MGADNQVLTLLVLPLLLSILADVVAYGQSLDLEERWSRVIRLRAKQVYTSSLRG